MEKHELAIKTLNDKIFSLESENKRRQLLINSYPRHKLNEKRKNAIVQTEYIISKLTNSINSLINDK